MKFVRKIALLSLITSMATSSLVVNLHARSDDQSNNDSKKNSVINDLRKKHKLEDAPLISLRDLMSRSGSFTLGSVRDAILQARFGSDYQKYIDAIAAKQKTDEERKTKLTAKGYSSTDIDAINEKIAIKKLTNQVIQSADISKVSNESGNLLFDTNKPYKASELAAALKECKSLINYPTRASNYQDIVDFLNDSSNDGDVSVVTLADAELFVQDILSDIQAIKATYRSTDNKKNNKRNKKNSSSN